MEQLGCRLVLFLGRHIHPEKTVSYCTVGALAFWPRSAFQRKPAWIWSQGGHTLEKQYKEGGMSVGSEKNREATSCQGFLSFLYFFFPIAPYWQANWLFFGAVFCTIFPTILSLFICLSPSSASQTISANYLTWFSFSCPMSSFTPASFSLGILVHIAN